MQEEIDPLKYNSLYPFHNNLFVRNEDNEKYLPWFSDEGFDLGFTIFNNEYQGVFVYIKRESLNIDTKNNTINFDYIITKNPYEKKVNTPEFLKLVQETLVEMLTKLSDDLSKGN